jgi:hypothetical protein
MCSAQGKVFLLLIILVKPRGGFTVKPRGDTGKTRGFTVKLRGFSVKPTALLSKHAEVLIA